MSCLAGVRSGSTVAEEKMAKSIGSGHRSSKGDTKRHEPQLAHVPSPATLDASIRHNGCMEKQEAKKKRRLALLLLAIALVRQLLHPLLLLLTGEGKVEQLEQLVQLGAEEVEAVMGSEGGAAASRRVKATVGCGRAEGESVAQCGWEKTMT